MATKRYAAPGVGRPSKGDRHQFATRVPRADAQQVMQLAERYDVSYSDMLAELVRIGLLAGDAEIRLVEPTAADQQELSA